MASTPEELGEMPPPEMVERPRGLIQGFPQCFCFGYVQLGRAIQSNPDGNWAFTRLRRPRCLGGGSRTGQTPLTALQKKIL